MWPDDPPDLGTEEEHACADCGVPADEPCAPWCSQAPQTRAQLDAADEADREHDERMEAA